MNTLKKVEVIALRGHIYIHLIQRIQLFPYLILSLKTEILLTGQLLMQKLHKLQDSDTLRLLPKKGEPRDSILLKI